MGRVRRCRDDELPTILAIINAAASAYEGVIPADQWHQPYMTMLQLRAELDAGVAFWGFEDDGVLAGVMGIQPVRDVDLIRHAYVKPDRQRSGIGALLLTHLRPGVIRRTLVGTWAAAGWAIEFYTRNGFARVPERHAAELFKRYWSIPDEQAEASVVLACPPYAHDAISRALDTRRERG
jgi:GNAT superfamily N-acetyltransferase